MKTQCLPTGQPVRIRRRAADGEIVGVLGFFAIALVILQVIASGLNQVGASQHLATALWGAFLLAVMVFRSIWKTRFLQMMFERR